MKETISKTDSSEASSSEKEFVEKDSNTKKLGVEAQTEFKTRLVLSPSQRITDRQNSMNHISRVTQSLEDKVVRLEELISHSEALSAPVRAAREQYAGRPASNLSLEKAEDVAPADFVMTEFLHAKNRNDPGVFSEPEVKPTTTAPPHSEVNAHASFAFQSNTYDKDTSQSHHSEALKQLVSKIIREELRGPLGEKITFNIRKLVRGEIESVTKTSNNEETPTDLDS